MNNFDVGLTLQVIFVIASSLVIKEITDAPPNNFLLHMDPLLSCPFTLLRTHTSPSPKIHYSDAA